MEYISTRGDKRGFDSADAIIKGLADDGGLFVPKTFPKAYDISGLEKFREMDYKETAYEIMKNFLTDFSEKELNACIERAYGDKFDDEMIAPLVKSEGDYFLELFHGRTLAFKDMALSILPYLMETAIEKKKMSERLLILTATSGDTGKAAMEGFKDVGGIDVVVLFPKAGVSKVQELQMTTQEGKNLCAVAVEGNFDDAQTAVKSVFNDKALAKEFKERNIVLSSANSINIGRLIPQVVYYFYGYFQLVSGGEIELGEQINICVPTGNFGNILAAYYAKRLGLPIKKLICASNKNKVLFDFFESGIYDRNRDLHLTNSPSMDILVSSNLERLLYMISGENTDKLMKRFSENGRYEFDAKLLKNEGFVGGYTSESECLSAISELYDDAGYIIDTHTAIAYFAYKTYVKQTDDAAKTIITATASPYKFTKSVMKAIGEGGRNEFDLIKRMAELRAENVPEQIRDLDKKEVIHKTCLKKEEMKDFIRNYEVCACHQNSIQSVE